MSRVRFWDALASWVLPLLVLAVGIFPPHVHPPLAGALALAGLLLAVALLGAGRIRSPGAGAAAPLLAGAALAGLSAAAALYPARSVRILIVWLVGGIALVAARGLGGDGEARRAARSVILLATVLSVIGLNQTLFSFPAAAEAAGPSSRSGSGALSGSLDTSPPLEGDEGGTDRERRSEALLARLRSARAVGTLGLPALLASILILAIPLTAAEAVSERRGRPLWIAALAMQAGALAATRSVGGLAGLAVATLACASGWADLRPAARRTLLVLVLVGAAALLAPRLLDEDEGSAPRSLWLRLANWRAAASMIVSHPLLGVGPDNYAVAFPQHRSWASNETQHAHNGYLEAAVDLGLPIIPLIAIGVAALARAASSASRRRDGGRGLTVRRRALAVACVAWGVQAFFDFTTYVAATLVPFLAVAGLLMRERSRPEGAADRPVTSGPPAGIPARALILAAASVAAIVAVPDAFSRRHLDASVEAASRRDFFSAAEEARLAAAWNPFDAEAHLILSRTLLDLAWRRPPSDRSRAADLAEALEEAEVSVRLDPRTANRRAALALARAAVGDGAGAYAAAAAAARLNPFRPSYAAERDMLLRILKGEGGPGSSREGRR